MFFFFFFKYANVSHKNVCLATCQLMSYIDGSACVQFMKGCT